MPKSARKGRTGTEECNIVDRCMLMEYYLPQKNCTKSCCVAAHATGLILLPLTDHDAYRYNVVQPEGGMIWMTIGGGRDSMR